MHLRSLLSLSALACTLLGAAHSLPVAAQVSRLQYVDVYEYLNDAQFEAWLNMTSQLRSNFDDICGDTFCEGDYSNIESLRYLCSVAQSNGRIGQCIWVFAGSYEEINRATGSITVNARSWGCQTPLVPGTTIDALLAALAGDQPLYAPLPGTQTTIYDGLTDCL